MYVPIVMFLKDIAQYLGYGLRSILRQSFFELGTRKSSFEAFEQFCSWVSVYLVNGDLRRLEF